MKPTNTNWEKREILEAASKACGMGDLQAIELSGVSLGIPLGVGVFERTGKVYWNPITISADTAAMCAKLEINTFWLVERVECSIWRFGRVSIPHDGTPEGKKVAWRLAATMVAAKIGGYPE